MTKLIVPLTYILNTYSNWGNEPSFIRIAQLISFICRTLVNNSHPLWNRRRAPIYCIYSFVHHWPIILSMFGHIFSNPPKFSKEVVNEWQTNKLSKALDAKWNYLLFFSVDVLLRPATNSMSSFSIFFLLRMRVILSFSLSLLFYIVFGMNVFFSLGNFSNSNFYQDYNCLFSSIDLRFISAASVHIWIECEFYWWLRVISFEPKTLANGWFIKMCTKWISTHLTDVLGTE